VSEAHLDSTALVEIVTTTANEEDASRLARVLVEERLAACGSWRPIRSVYRWKGELCDEREIELHLKTTAGAAPRAERRLQELHPYETPSILRVRFLAANDDYASWVRSHVGESSA
jgi:periplasmic divalent cation tolerance protein